MIPDFPFEAGRLLLQICPGRCGKVEESGRFCIHRWRATNGPYLALTLEVVKRILIVEDNELNRDVLSRRLARRGFDVLIAFDGPQGMEMAHHQTPDLILLDLGLPQIDGWECARRLKADAATEGIPIIALSAHAMVGDRQRALEAGCDEFGTKPIDFPGLLKKIDQFLQVAP